MFEKKPKVRIVVQESDRVRVYDAIDEISVTEGKSFKYQNYLGQICYLTASVDYKPVIKLGFSYYGQKSGNVSAAEIIYSPGWNLWKSADEYAPGESYYELVRSSALARAGRELKGKPQINWTLILIIVAVIAVIGLTVYGINKTNKEEQQQEVTYESSYSL